MISKLSLREVFNVLFKRSFRFKGCAIDTLELRSLLVASPVRTSHSHQLEVPEPTRRGNVRASTKVRKGLRVLVGRQRCRICGSVHLVGARGHRIDNLELVGLLSKQRPAFTYVVFGTHKGLVFGDDLSHGRFNACEIIIAESGIARQCEVIVKAVVNHGANGKVGAGPESQHRLG